MSANIKWDVETTIKFIQLYKLHPCLWNFQSPEYKIKQKRDAALDSIVQEMNITGFGTQEVKNKIKNLRSTYQQENKKIQDSKKSGAGLSNVYISSIKWLKEMEEVFSKDLNKHVYENIRHPTNEDTGSHDNSFATSSHSNNNQEAPANIPNNQQVPVTVTTATTTATTSDSGKTPKAKKRTREIFQAVSDLKKLNEGLNSENETVFDLFGRSVALQLKNLSAENALLAQNRIQNILTEYGIQELRQRTASHSSLSNHSYTASRSSSSNQSYQRPTSANSDTTASHSSLSNHSYTASRSSSSNQSYQRPTSANSDTTNARSHNDFYQYDEAYAESPPYLPIPAPSSPVHNVNSTPNSVSTNDIIATAMFAAFEADERQQV